MSWMCLLWILRVGLPAPASIPQTSSYGLTDAESSCFGYRRQLLRGRVQIQIQIAGRNQSTGRLVPLLEAAVASEEWTIYIDGDKRRIDKAAAFAIQMSPNLQMKESNSTPVTTRIAFDGKEFCHWSESAAIPTGHLAVRRGSQEQLAELENWWIDVRYLGLVPTSSGLLYRYADYDWSKPKDRGPVSSRIFVRDGSRCVEEHYVRENGVESFNTYDAERGFNIIDSRIGNTLKSGDVASQQIQVKLEAFAQGVWFPRTIHFERLLNGDVIAEEKWTIVDAVFNQPVAASTFTADGFSIPDGVPVVDLLSGKNGTTKDSRIVAIPASEANGSRRSGGSVLLTVNLFFIALTFLWLAFRQRNRTGTASG